MSAELCIAQKLFARARSRRRRARRRAAARGARLAHASSRVRRARTTLLPFFEDAQLENFDAHEQLKARRADAPRRPLIHRRRSSASRWRVARSSSTTCDDGDASDQRPQALAVCAAAHLTEHDGRSRAASANAQRRCGKRAYERCFGSSPRLIDCFRPKRRRDGGNRGVRGSEC